MLLLVLSTNAQSVFSSLKFEAPEKLIMPKNGTVNVRERPNLKAPLVARWFDEDEKEILRLAPGTLCQVLGEENGWYKVFFPIYVYDVEPGMALGYVSQTVVQESPVTTLESVNEEFMKYDGEEFGYITKTGSKTIPYLYVSGKLPDDASEYAFKETTYAVNLWLGKQVGDLLVFKYPAMVIITINPNYKGKDIIKSDPTSSITIGSLSEGGLGWYPFDKENGMLYFDFEKYGDKELELIFKGGLETHSFMKENDEDYVVPTLYFNDERLKQGW